MTDQQTLANISSDKVKTLLPFNEIGLRGFGTPELFRGIL